MKNLKSRREFLQKLALGSVSAATLAASPSLAMAAQTKMDAIEAMMTRRTIRKFAKQTVSDADIDTMLRCAMAAPSARGKRPWEFIVTKDMAKIKNFGFTAPLAILCCLNSELDYSPAPGLSFGALDLSCSVENILIAANALGLGACWKSAYPVPKRMESYRKGFNLPESLLPISFVIIGYPDEKGKIVDRYNAQRIHYENYKA